MTWSLDPPVRIGAIACAAIVDVNISVRKAGRGLAGHGAKRPLLFLLLGQDAATGLDVKGKHYDAEEIERLYPEAIAQMSALVKTGGSA
ncbi:MAG: hypothetical protein HKN02_14580 [Rhodobacteraceae bacterium]|nr:hypothetical protein [Paracoccaceae bacterium]